MSGHIDIERMHDLVDGLLSPDAEAGDRAHLDACEACRDAFERLEDVVAQLRTLPAEAAAPAGLWTGIEARISASSRGSERTDGGPSGPEVVRLPVERTRRRFTLTVPQLAAAAAVVSLLSAGTMWRALAPDPADVPVASAPLEGGFGPAARVATSGEAAYDTALTELQSLVAANRDFMAPETVAALDRSLATIDEALAEIRRALQQDPNSELLTRLLANQQRSKLRVLRQAVTAVQARS